MTDTSVDGQVQRTQAMLYAKASNEPEERLNGRMQIERPSCLEPGCGETGTSGSAVGGWGNTSVVRPEGAPCPYHNKSARTIKCGVTRWPPTLLYVRFGEEFSET